MKKFSLTILQKNIFIISTICLALFFSCRQIHVYDSKAVVLSRTTDASLKDSSLIYGYVLTAPDGLLPEQFADIWIVNPSYKTVSDTTGFFRLKLPAGTYTINSLGKYSNSDMTIILKNITLLAGEKVEVKFLQGYIAE